VYARTSDNTRIAAIGQKEKGIRRGHGALAALLRCPADPAGRLGPDMSTLHSTGHL